MDQCLLRGYYRSMYRWSRRAVNFQKPQVFVIRSYLRQKFDTEPRPIDDSSMQNTVQFLQAAANWTGLERRVVTTMVHVEHARWKRAQFYAKAKGRHAKDKRALDVGYGAYDDLVAGLNRSMDLCM